MPSFSLSFQTSDSKEGKILIKNPHGSSRVWKHFGFYKTGNKVLKDFAVCFICKKECKYSGGTTNLNQHLEKYHSELCSAPASGSKPIQTQITTLVKRLVMKLTTATHSKFTECIVEYICGDLALMSVVGSKHFRSMVNFLTGVNI